MKKKENAPVESDRKKKTGKADSLHEGSKIVRMSLTWYRDKFHNLVRCLFVSGIANIILILILVVSWLIRPTPVYYAVTPDLRVMEMQPLSQPYIQNAGLINWVAQTVTSTFSLNFRNWRTQLGQVRQNYDEEAFTTLVVAMKNNGIIDLIEKRRLVCSVVMSDTPVIYASGMQEGRYMWRVKVPVLLNYESSEGIVHRQNLEADILIQRANTLEYPIGVNIRQIVLSAHRS